MPLLRALGSRWSVSLAGTVLPCATVWFLGPLLPALEDWPPRLAIVLALLVLWAGGNLLLDLRRLRRDAALARGVASPDASVQEAEAVRAKLTEAMALLRKARGTRGALYEQPWYVIIGPPGAGKTTALLNAGLRFPLAAAMGRGAVAGVGGTRLCEWWFTDGAVLIDTAGRYTTQDSDAAVDRAGWDAFLGLLRRTRPRQPLNGIIVAIALNDVVGDAPAERTAHARAIRSRIKELEARLGLGLPVYALFTKVDLLAGFTEFFDDLDRERREQVWGTTFPLKPSPASPASTVAEAFATAFRPLAERLDRRLFDRLQAEPNPDRRALISAFPAQFASIEAPLGAFLGDAFGAAPGDPAPMLRGVYLTSATQEGTPIDRLTGAISRAFGLDQRRAPRLRPEDGRTYFLAGLLRDVVFREAMLVAERPGAARRRMLVRAAGFATVLLLATGAGAVLLRERAGIQDRIDAVAAGLAEYEQAASVLPLDPVADADLPRLAPWLDQARALSQAQGRPPAGAGLLPELDAAIQAVPGLSQDGKLAAGMRALYRNALDHALLPRLIWRLEAQMRGNLAQPDFLYEATRIYLMLGGSGPLDRDLLRQWMTLDWEATYPGGATAPLRESLARHLDALLAEPLPQAALDGELVAQARATFGRVSLAQRVYSRIKPSAAAQRIPPWRPSDPLGAAGVRVFVRISGRPLSDGIPGFFTVDGFYKVLLPSLARAAQAIAAESWVLGQRVELEPNGPQMRVLERDVIALYLAEYGQAWEAMLADLDVAPLRSLTQAAQDLYIIASPNSPMRELLASASRQLGLAAGAPAPAARTAVPLDETAQRLQVLLNGGARPDGPPLPPGHEIDDRFKPLRDLMGDGSGAPIDHVLKPLTDLQQQLAKIAAANRSATPPPAGGEDPAVALRTEAIRQPQPLARWLNSIAASGVALRGGGARQQIIAAFNAGGGPAALCPAVVSRFPFAPAASADATLEEFTRLFGPGGALDGFFNTQLKPYVDTSGRAWKAQPVDGVQPPVAAADIAQFQRAAAIRDLFFAGGRTTPQLRLDVTPAPDPGGSQATLDLDGTAIAGGRGPARATQAAWPGPGRTHAAGLSFEAPAPGGAAALAESGPWALFRLFRRGKVQAAGSPDRFTLTLQGGDRQAVFEVRGGSTAIPFTPTLLQEFRCPAIQ